MRGAQARQACRRAAILLLLAPLCLAPKPHLATASTIHLQYEDAFDDVMATEETEAVVKSAFLLRFPDFINWRKSPGDTLHIGVAGDGPMLEVLTVLAEQENQAGLGAPHVIAVSQITSPEAALRCEILVIGNGAAPGALPPMLELHEAGTLTVGVWDEPRGGTVIHLFRKGNRVRFDISHSLAKEAGLMISSKLLNLAREQSSRVVPGLFKPARG